MKSLSIASVIALWLAILPLTAQAQRALHCWTDAAGRRNCTDALPSEAVNLAREEINVHNPFRRSTIDRALTPEEQAAVTLEEARQAAEVAADKTRRQTDRAMLMTYSNEEQLLRVFNERIALADNNIQTASYNVLSLRDGLATQLLSVGNRELSGRPVEEDLLTPIRQGHEELLAQVRLKNTFEQQRQALDAEIAEVLARYRRLTRQGEADSASGAE